MNAFGIVVISLCGLIGVWVACAVVIARREQRIHERHGFTWVGENSGWVDWIDDRNEGCVTRAPWEKCLGEPVRIALPEASRVWPIESEPTEEERVEFRRRFEAWMRERGVKYEIEDKLTGMASPNSSI
jgi:hypothetical protein